MEGMTGYDADAYILAREVLQRGVAAVYLVAFVAAVRQFPALLGERGLLPAPRFLARVPFRAAPSLFHWRYSDRLLRTVCVLGIALAASVVAGLPQLGPEWVPLLVFLALWWLYLSIVNVGQAFYSFGWESLLLEAGVLAAFLGSARSAPPLAVLLLFRWLVFRLEFGAGLIKMRGDRVWRDLTALYYHHETQPLPNRLSWYFHHLPRPLHRLEVLGNHATQLGVPFLLFAPQPVASVAAAAVLVTQGWLVASGNFAWLNALTMVLAFSALDDRSVHAVLPFWSPGPVAATPLWFTVLALGVAAFVAVLSYWPVRNMLSHRQLMNASFNPWHLVDTYGAFGSISRVRDEVIVEGTRADRPDPDAEWRAYEFRAKPGDPHRRPRQVAPYHLRLDWLMWFLALGSPIQYAWFPTLLTRLLENDAATLRLLAGNPFPEGPPRWVRARIVRYRFTTRAERRASGDWWVAGASDALVRPIDLATLRRVRGQ